MSQSASTSESLSLSDSASQSASVSMSQSVSASDSASLSASVSATVLPDDGTLIAPAGDGPAAPAVTGTAPAVIPLTTAPTPVGIEVPDDAVPLGVMEDEDELQSIEDQDEEIAELEDGEVPLVNMDSDQGMGLGHRVVHYTELILAAIMGGAYIGSTRKQKKELSALRKRIDDEER